jgi:hypothetical protein
MGLGYALGVAAGLTTDLDEAERLATEADELLRATGHPIGIAHTVEARATIAFDRGELSKASQFLAEAIEIYRTAGNLGCCAHALESAAVIVSQAGQPETAAKLLGAADQLRLRSGQGRKPGLSTRDGGAENRIAPLDPTVREAAFSAGRQHTLESAARAALDALSTVARE